MWVPLEQADRSLDLVFGSSCHLIQFPPPPEDMHILRTYCLYSNGCLYPWRLEILSIHEYPRLLVFPESCFLCSLQERLFGGISGRDLGQRVSELLGGVTLLESPPGMDWVWTGREGCWNYQGPVLREKRGLRLDRWRARLSYGAFLRKGAKECAFFPSCLCLAVCKVYGLFCLGQIW